MRLFNGLRGRQQVHLLHIGKTGGTAVKHALRPFLITSGNVIILHTHIVTLSDIPKGDKVIFFLRDPISRFVSGFYSRQRQGKPRYFNPWSSSEETAFKRFDTPEGLALTLSSDDTKFRGDAISAMKGIQHLKDPYRKWFGTKEYFLSRIDDLYFIGFQESLSRDFDFLKSKLTIPGSAELPSDEVNAHKSPQSVDKNLSDKARENLKAWYREDYDFIEVCNQLRRERNRI
jgi:hypothetical protein